MGDHDPELLPVEEKIGAAVRRLVAAWRQLRGWARRVWDAHFTGNPLLAREIGLGEGRRWWRSPFVWASAMAALPFLLSLTVQSISLHLFIQFNTPAPATGTAQVWLFWMRWVGWAQMLLWIATTALFAWLVARAWARERTQSQRDQIGVTPLTSSQLLGARTLTWLWPLLAVDFLGALAVSVNVALMRRGLALPAVLWIGLQRGFSTLLWNVVFDMMVVGLATRLSLSWVRPALTVALVLSVPVAFTVFEALVGFTLPPSSWTGGVFIAVFWFRRLGYLALALWAWIGLRRRVARAYGMSEPPSRAK